MKSFSMSAKIWFVFGILCLAFAGTAVFSSMKLIEEKDTVNRITTVLVKRDQHASDIAYLQRSMLAAVLEVIAREDEVDSMMQAKAFDMYKEDYLKNITAYKKIADAQGLKLMEKYEADYPKFVEAAEKAKDLGLQNKNAEASAILFTVDDVRTRMRKTLAEINELTDSQLKAEAANADKSASSAILIQSIVAAISILTGFIIAFFVLRSVSQAINAVVRGLSESSERVTTAANQIASASQELSSASTEQAAALVETASATEEMSSMVTKNSENAKATASTSAVSTEKAVHGKDVVNRMIESMNQISSSNDAVMSEVTQANQSMLDVVKVIDEIGSKTKVINDIVFQTKLLSFNASVEAARAGEHGKGFAVVAEEVGSLANMSGKAAKEISDLLAVSVQRVNDLVQSTQNSVQVKVEEGKRAVSDGNDVARQCGDVLDEIVMNVDTASKMATEISAASEEQSRGVIEITKAMSQLDQMTQMNTATSQECASAANELSAQAEALKQLVVDLVHTVEGKKDGATSKSAATHVAAKPVEKKEKAKVVAIKREPKKAHQADSHTSARVAGSDIPLANDKGFKDI